MLDGSDLVYVYDGSFEGLLTAVFDAYQTKRTPLRILPAGMQQATFGTAVIAIEADEAKALRVTRGIRQKLGMEAYETVQAVFLSENEDRATVIYRYLVYGFSTGKGFTQHLAHKSVGVANDIARTVGRERQFFMEFIRFAEMENSVFFSRIHPKNCVVPLIMDHFVQRYNIQPFVIYDETHKLAGIFDTREWYLASAENLHLPDYAPEEAMYKHLWKAFYDAIAIKERINPKLRRNHMPKRYWRDMLEMNDSLCLESQQSISEKAQLLTLDTSS